MALPVEFRDYEYTYSTYRMIQTGRFFPEAPHIHEPKPSALLVRVYANVYSISRSLQRSGPLKLSCGMYLYCCLAAAVLAIILVHNIVA